MRPVLLAAGFAAGVWSIFAYCMRSVLRHLEAVVETTSTNFWQLVLWNVLSERSATS
jgi:hypothetical protein